MATNIFFAFALVSILIGVIITILLVIFSTKEVDEKEMPAEIYRFLKMNGGTIIKKNKKHE